MVQTIPGFHHIVDTHQVCEYPDSTISKALTVLKWRMITMFNSKLLEKQIVKNCFASYTSYEYILKWWMITMFNRKLLERQSVKNRFASYEVHIP